MELIFKNILFATLLSIVTITANAQITAQEANKAMGRGINIGNTMEPETEGGWNNGKVQEYYFDDYKTAGFTSVRIPVRWDKHTSNSSPYKIDDAWMTRVEQVVDWGLKRDLFIVINAHHEDWIKTGYDKQNLRDRFDSIWSQIATRFQNKSEKLIFEIINEPNGLTVAQINELNARILSIIRKTNPTRIVLFSGNNYAGFNEMMTAAIPNDPYLIGYFHSYDPWNFAGSGIGTWGTASDRDAINSMFVKVAQWSKTHNIPVTINEFGAMQKCDYNSRMYHYSVYTELALKNGLSFNAWEDGGDFKIYDRSGRKWNDIKDILIYTSDTSITQLKITQIEDRLNITWQNRSNTNDSIRIERKNSSGTFVPIATLPGNSTSYIDSTTETYKICYYRVVAHYPDGSLIPSYPISGFKIATVRSPFLGSPISIPGVIEAENFDEGGELLTFHDIDFINNPGKYRTNVGVDIMSRDDGGFQITNIAEGEWLEYTIDIPETNEYVIDTWVSSVEGGGKFSYLIGKVGVPSLIVPQTSNAQTLVKTTSTKVLNAGEQVMRLRFNSIPTFNVDRIEISKKGTGVTDLKDQNICRIYSSTPGTLLVDLSNDVKAELILSAVDGRMVFNGALRQGSNQIELPGKTIYFYRINTKAGAQQTGKIIVN